MFIFVDVSAGALTSKFGVSRVVVMRLWGYVRRTNVDVISKASYFVPASRRWWLWWWWWWW